MRIFGRVLYALLAVGIFLLIFTYSIDLTANRYYEEVFGSSLTDTNSDLPEFYYFYTSIPDFHKSDPIISVDYDGYIIRGYEVAKTSINNDNQLEVLEYIYILVYSTTQDLSVINNLSITDDNGGELFEIPLVRFKTLNLLNGVDERGFIYLSKDLFLSTDFDKIKLVNKDEEIVVDAQLNLDETDFTIKSNLEDFFALYNKIPDEEDIDNLNVDNIGLKIIHIDENTRLDSSIVLISMAVYFVILIVSTYLIFFRRRKYD
ncbi:MAG: hypothetical protein RQ856_01085 [Candidatus Izemoplasmatales bacterium]|nr:hypothetical protein [Candidatus Izemoplasmatales bacterium]